MNITILNQKIELRHFHTVRLLLGNRVVLETSVDCSYLLQVWEKLDARIKEKLIYLICSCSWRPNAENVHICFQVYCWLIASLLKSCVILLFVWSAWQSKPFTKLAEVECGEVANVKLGPKQGICRSASIAQMAIDFCPMNGDVHSNWNKCAWLICSAV